MNLPTKITFSRIVATILMIIALFVLSLIPNLSTPELGNTRINLIFLIIFIFFLIASYTDHLDGKLARKNNQVTDLGKFLDPIADTLLLVTAIVLLGTVGVSGLGKLPTWFPILVVSRDLILVAGTILVGTLLHNYQFVRPHWTGKICTFLQIKPFAVRMFRK